MVGINETDPLKKKKPIKGKRSLLKGIKNLIKGKSLEDAFKTPEFPAPGPTFTLPIPPQTYTIKMVSASKVTPTIGGVVEETNSNKFWLITMTGTTGVGVSRNSEDENDRRLVAKKFRDTVATTGLLAGVSANLTLIASKYGGIADRAVDAIDAGLNGDWTGIAGNVIGALNDRLTPPLPYAGSAVNDTTNGFTEIQELHRFFYAYSKLKDDNPNKYQLMFKNFKTGQQWKCAIKEFSIQQNAQNPLLYKYTISLQAWDVGPVNSEEKEENENNRFAPGGDLGEVNTVGTRGWNTIIGNKHNKNFRI
jgi:hypothetical protein